MAIAALLFPLQQLCASVAGTSNTELIPDHLFGADYLLTIYQDYARTDPTGIWLSTDGTVLSVTDYTVDEGSDWYLTYPGDIITTLTTAGAGFPILIHGSPLVTNSIPVANGDIYLGVNTGRFGPPFPPRDVYGWVHLQNDNGTLTMVDNAVAYGESGIIVGTTLAVDEPLTLALVLAGAVVVCTRRSVHSATERIRRTAARALCR